MPPRHPKRRSVARVAVACLAACLLAATATAAEPSSSLQAPAPIRSALQGAWQQHPTYRITEAQLAASRARRDAAGQPIYNPELEANADDEGTDRTATLGLNLTLDLSGKRRVRLDAAQARVVQAEAQAELDRRAFAKTWLTSLADVRAAQQRVLIGERRLALVTRFAGLAEKQFAADDISGLDRDVALLARDEAEAEQSSLIAERADALSRFQGVGGTDALATDLSLPGDPTPAPVALDPGAVQQTPEWRIASAAADAADREVLVARRNRVPDPTIGVRAGRIDYDGLRDNVFGFSVSVPLFVRNSYRAEVVAADADAAAALAETDRTRAELIADRQRIVDSYRAARDAWTRWKASRGTDVQRRADLLERMWREGELSTSDYLLQIRQTQDTALAGAELEARLWRGYVDYLAASGQLERWSGLEGTP